MSPSGRVPMGSVKNVSQVSPAIAIIYINYDPQLSLKCKYFSLLTFSPVSCLILPSFLSSSQPNQFIYSLISPPPPTAKALKSPTASCAWNSGRHAPRRGRGRAENPQHWKSIRTVDKDLFIKQYIIYKID